VRKHGLRSVLAVPFRWWAVLDGEPVSTLGGCVYVDRREDEVPFDDDDVELVLDLTALAERTINLVRKLTAMQSELDATREEVSMARRAAAESYRLGHFESRDPAFIESVLKPLEKAAQADCVGILLTGPTGAGKTHLAAAFHYASRRKNGPFVVLDCGQITSSEALGAELFGFSKRSGFNAPEEGRVGKARLADGGTLFIDEIGSMPVDLQQRLLRLIQTGAFSPLGAGAEERTDIQVIAAANQDLQALVRQGGFREDLLWRISEMTIHLPPLDERQGDIDGLALTFLEAARRRFGRDDVEGFDAAAIETLRKVRWRGAGNIRGLEHTVNRTVLMAPTPCTRIGPQHLVLGNGGTSETSSGQSPPRRVNGSELKQLLTARIAKLGGRLTHVARDPEVAAAFGYADGAMPPSTLHLRIRELDLERELEAARCADRNEVDFDVIIDAVRRHRTGAAAAAALGITRDSLIWQLRKAGTSIRAVLRHD